MFEDFPIRGCSAIAEDENASWHRQLVSTDRQQQRVVGDVFAAGMRDVPGAVDPVKARADPANPRIGDDASHRIAVNQCGSERLENGEGPIGESVRWAHQGDVELIARQPSQPQHRLHSGDPAAADDDREPAHRGVHGTLTSARRSGMSHRPPEFARR